jgi:hypothetical protein
MQNYPQLKGTQTNLYKCFLPIGWRISGERSIAGFLHPEGPYDDPKGGTLREAMYRRLRAHFQFLNKKMLFPIGDSKKYSINLYGERRHTPQFDHISNLFVPSTIDTSYEHEGSEPVGGYKTAEGKWNTVGHKDRIISVTEAGLALFAKLYDLPGTPAVQARLPSVHAKSLLSVLEKLANHPKRLGDLKDRRSSAEAVEYMRMMSSALAFCHFGVIAWIER